MLRLMSMSQKFKNLNLLVACFTMGDALALRMVLASNLETNTTLKPLPKERKFLTL
jgi:hypothetical protein